MNRSPKVLRLALPKKTLYKKNLRVGRRCPFSLPADKIYSWPAAARGVIKNAKLSPKGFLLTVWTLLLQLVTAQMTAWAGTGQVVVAELHT